MRTRTCPMTPLAAVAGGLLAGVAGTACMDAVQYVRYRRKGCQDSPLTWEFASAGVTFWLLARIL